MVPAGIVASGGALLVEAVFGVSATGEGNELDAGARGGGGVKTGICGGTAGVTGALLVTRLARCGRRCGPGDGCARNSRAVKNKIRTSVVAFILRFWLQAWNWLERQRALARLDFFDSWRRAGCSR